MKKEKLVFTVLAKDRTGIVRTISDIVLANNGNWLESSMARLAGQFAGIVSVEVDETDKPQLLSQLDALRGSGIIVSATDPSSENSSENSSQNGSQNNSQSQSDSVNNVQVGIAVEANDRTGIIDEIAAALAGIEVNIERMTTRTESASMAGYDLFQAELFVSLPTAVDRTKLEQVLENVSNDLMVTFLD